MLRQRLIYAGTFNALNVMRSLDSSLMPRSGLVDVSPTGLPTGPLLGFSFCPVPTKTAWAIIGNGVYLFDVEHTGSAAVHVGNLAVTPSLCAVAFAVDAGGITYITVAGDKCYKLDPVAVTLTPLTGSPGGTCITIHGESLGSRLLVGNVSGANTGGVAGQNLVYASTLNNYTNWALAGQIGADPNFPANALTIGDAWPVNGLYSQRTHLAIAKQESWWVVTGPLNAFTARPIFRNTTRWQQTSGGGSMDGDDNVWFVPFEDDIPAVFDGAKMGESRALHFNGRSYTQGPLPPPFAVTHNLRHDEVVMGAVTAPGPLKVAIRQEGLWTFHQLHVPGNFQSAWLSAGSEGRIHTSDGGAGGVVAKFYTWETHLDTHPPISGDPLGSNVDPTGTLVASVTLPEYWGRSGEVISVRSVIVDMKRWNTGFTAHNHYDGTVTNLRNYQDQAAQPYASPTPIPFSFDEVTSDVPGGVGASQYLRLQHNMTEEYGNGFQVAFTNVEGLSIERLQVYLDVKTPTPRGV